MKGLSYFGRFGFSVNEGGIPNIHIRWWRPIGFYICRTETKRYSWFWWPK